MRSSVGMVGTSFPFSILDNSAGESPVRCPSCVKPILRRRRRALSFCPIRYWASSARNESGIGILASFHSVHSRACLIVHHSVPPTRFINVLSVQAHRVAVSPEEDCSAVLAAEEFGPAELELAEFAAPELAAPGHTLWRRLRDR